MPGLGTRFQVSEVGRQGPVIGSRQSVVKWRLADLRPPDPLALFGEAAKAHQRFRAVSNRSGQQPVTSASLSTTMAENPDPVCAVADVPVNGVISREVGDELVAIYNIDGAFYATEARGTHGLADLADGMLEGDVIECSFHFGAFHVPSGK